jgi:hypothetical protein
MAGIERLGMDFDISQGWTPQDFHSAGVTGAWVSAKQAEGVNFLVSFKAGTSGDNATLTLQEAEDSSGTGAQNLAVIDHYWVKKNATPTDDLTGDEQWVQVTQAAAATITATAADYEQFLIPVLEEDLDAGYSYVNLSVGSTAASQIACCHPVLAGLKVQRTPANLTAPGA